jgi:hypothetical protein
MADILIDDKGEEENMLEKDPMIKFNVVVEMSWFKDRAHFLVMRVMNTTKISESSSDHAFHLNRIKKSDGLSVLR